MERERSATMWDNHVKPAPFLSNDRRKVKGSDDHQEDEPLIKPSTRVHGESWDATSKLSAHDWRNLACKGVAMWLPQKKIIDVLPVEVRAMAFRVQACILSTGSRLKRMKTQNTGLDKRGRGGCTRYSFLLKNKVAVYVPSTNCPVRDTWLHPPPELASIQPASCTKRSPRRSIFMINFVAQRLNAGLDCFSFLVAQSLTLYVRGCFLVMSFEERLSTCMADIVEVHIITNA